MILGFLVIGLLAPLANFALAQIGGENLNECCEIKAEFSALSVTIGGVVTPLQFNHKTFCIVGAKNGSCVIDGIDVSTNFQTYTDFTNPNKIKCGYDTVTQGYRVIEGWGLVCLLNTVYNVTNWIFYLMMIAVVIIFVAAGAKYMMSSGDAEKTKSAKNMIIFAIVGLVVALVARLIPSVVKLIVGM